MPSRRGRLGAARTVVAASILASGAVLAPAAAGNAATGSPTAAAAATAPTGRQAPAGRHAPAGRTAGSLTGRQYVALGDSYSAGVGTDSPTNGCYQSPWGYPPLVAKATGANLTYAACSGATTADLRAQLAAVDTSTDLVTLTIGGNDAGFGDIILACVGGSDAQCAGAMSTSAAVIAGVLPQRLDAAYDALRAKAPRARVVVAGYPWIFGLSSCSTQPNVNARERLTLDLLTVRLNGAIQQQATSHGFRFADVTPTFLGHATCDPWPWINSYVPARVWDSFHPNRRGHQAYAEVVLGVLSHHRSAA